MHTYESPGVVHICLGQNRAPGIQESVYGALKYTFCIDLFFFPSTLTKSYLL